MPIIIARNPLIIPTPPPPPPPPQTGSGYLLVPSSHLAPDGLPYPDATNTGYTAYFDPTLGRKLKFSDLTPFSGQFQTSAANQIVEKLHITSSVKVSHPGVIFRGCLIEKTNGSGGNGVLYGVTDHNQGLTDYWTMQYCTMIGHPTAGEVTMLNVEWGNISWCDISGGTDGSNPWGPHDITFYHNYIHDLTPFNNSHSDCIQIVSGQIKVRYNTMISTNPSYPIGQYRHDVDTTGSSSVFPGNTSIVQIGKLTGTLRDVYIEDNLCDGGNYMSNANWSADTPDANGVTHIQDPSTNVYIQNNRLGRDQRFYSDGGGLHIHIPSGHNFVIANNLWDDDGSLAWG